MPTTPAADLLSAIDLVYPNIFGVHVGPAFEADLTARLQTFRDQFFAALDPNNANQALIIQWSVPISFLIASLQTGDLVVNSDYKRIDAVGRAVVQTLIAARLNGFVPDAALDAALTAAFNNAFT